MSKITKRKTSLVRGGSLGGSARYLLHGLLTTLDLLPILVPVWIAVFGLFAVTFLLFDRLQTTPVMLCGLLAASGLSVLVVRQYPRTAYTNREWHVATVLCILGIVVWGGFNLPFTAEHVITNRDPATYAVAGEWLVDHDSLRIPIPIDVFGHVKNVVAGSAGFSLDPNSGHPFIYAQGLHLLPALLGLIGRLVGKAYLLHANVLFGMAALLAVYGFGRLLVRPRWALLATATLAVTMPMIYFSRDTYTEPLAMVFTFGSLSLLWLAAKQGKLLWWFLAGFVAGAGALARIDAHLAYVGLVLFFGIWVAFAAREKRRRALWQVSASILGLAIPVIVGWLDAIRLSWPYYFSLQSMFYEELLALALAVIACVVLVCIAWKTTWLRRLDQSTRSWRQPVVVLVVISFVLVLSCRPFLAWYLQHLQNAGAHLDSQSFSELTTYWISWYLGPILTIAGVIGIGLAAAWASVRRDLLLVAAVLVVATTAAVYLISPSIHPDQIWASRRFLPVVFPGLAVFGALALDWAYQRYAQKERYARYFAVLAAASIFISALFVSSPLVLVRDTAELGSVLSICSALPSNSAVLLVGVARQQFVQPIETFCGFPTSPFGHHEADPLTAATLSRVAKNIRRAGRVPIVGVSGEQLSLVPTEQANLVDVVNYSYRQLEQTYLGPPQRVVGVGGSLRFGLIQLDGTIQPISAAPPVGSTVSTTEKSAATP